MSSFAAGVDSNNIQETVLGDYSSFKFFCLQNESNKLDEEITNEFNDLPIVSRLMISRTRLNSQISNVSSIRNNTKLYSVRKLDKFSPYDTQNRDEFLQTKDE